MKYSIIKARTSDYPNPIILQKGMEVEVGKVSTIPKWANWIECIISGNKGWVPLQILKKIDERHSVVLEDYTANELEIKIDEIFVSEREMNGWFFGYKVNEPQNKGWVPIENVKKKS
jgi:predicted Rdx family selenoprotein